jgi:hypothetical protein
MAEFPGDNTFDYSATWTNTQFATAVKNFLQATRQLPGGKAMSELTIASGSVSPVHGAHTLDTESEAATDDLASVATSLPDGAWLLLRPENTSRVVTVKHGAGGVGEIILDGAADYVLDKASKTLVLQRLGPQWIEIFRTGWDDAESGGQQLFAEDGDFTVPPGVTKAYVTAVGGGGGGGGGAGATGDSPSATADGSDGAAGGQSRFGTHETIAGATGGKGGSGLGRGGLSFSGGAHGQNKAGDLGGFGGLTGPTVLGLVGSGGNGGNGANGINETSGGGGGAGCPSVAPAVRRAIGGLTPGGTVAVTVGQGGAGGGGGTGAGGNGLNGAPGANGAVLIEW